MNQRDHWKVMMDRLDEILRDVERLDWLQKNCIEIITTNHAWASDFDLQVPIREFIDNAMKPKNT